MPTQGPRETEPKRVTIGARGSRLSLRQVELISALLRDSAPGVVIDVHEIRTEGDRSKAPLSQIGGLGVFTKAIEDALLAGTIDIAVHSLKDLPPQLASGLIIGAVPERGDVRDALVTRDGRGLHDLPSGARIGTGSERRAVQLRALRPDVSPQEIRGNVETRIRKVESGEYDAGVLALAGLERLGLGGKAAQVFSVDEMLPAVGQAALAVEVRAVDAATLAIVRAIEHAPARVAVEAERAFLARLGAGCRMPVGAYAVVADGGLRLQTMIADDRGTLHRREDAVAWRDDQADFAAARALGTRSADALMAATP